MPVSRLPFTRGPRSGVGGARVRVRRDNDHRWSDDGAAIVRLSDGPRLSPRYRTPLPA